MLGPAILIVLLGAACLLSSCASSDETKHDDHPVAQEQASKPTAPEAASEPKVGKPVGDDYLHGQTLGSAVTLDDVSVKDTLKYQLKRKGSKLDLHLFTNYSSKVSRDDLLLLSDAKHLRYVNMGLLGLTDQQIEPIGGLPLDRLELDGNAVKDLHALSGMTTLKSLKLSDDPINAEGMRVIASLPNLDGVDMPRTPISDSDLSLFYGMKRLRFLNLGGCPHLTHAAVERLKNKLPKCDITFDTTASKKLKPGFDALSRIECSLMEQGEWDEADAAVANTVSRWESDPKPSYELIAKGYRERAKCQEKMGRPRAQVQMLLKSLAVYCQHFPDDQTIPELEMECGEILARIPEPKAALAMDDKADAFWKAHPPSPARRWKYSVIMSRIGYHLILLGEFKKARATFERGLQWVKLSFPGDFMQEASFKQGLAWCDFKSGDVKSATPELKKLMHSYQERKKQDSQSGAASMLAQCYLAQGDAAGAEALLRSSLKLSTSNLQRAGTYAVLVKVLKAEKKQEEAERFTELFEQLTGKKLIDS
jgi:tetratricopeptide (TPR) repeat protein